MIFVDVKKVFRSDMNDVDDFAAVTFLDDLNVRMREKEERGL